MTSVREATTRDLDALRALGERVDPDELRQIVARGRVLVAETAGGVVGLLRWGLFWDEIPFMNLVLIAEDLRGRGLGRALVTAWEERMRSLGFREVMTSSLSDETAQHVYRRLGYVDCGSILLPGEALEILFRKPLGAGDPTPPQRTTS